MKTTCVPNAANIHGNIKLAHTPAQNESTAPLYLGAGHCGSESSDLVQCAHASDEKLCQSDLKNHTSPSASTNSKAR